jgi:hypothetical protein
MDLKKWAGAKGAKPGGQPPAASPSHAFGAPNPAGGAGAPVAKPPLFADVPSSVLPPDQAQWAKQGAKSPNRPDDPPPFADDPTRWAMARALVQKSWNAYQEPWAVVAHAYAELGGAQGQQPPGAPPASASPKPPIPGAGAPPARPQPLVPPTQGVR